MKHSKSKSQRIESKKTLKTKRNLGGRRNIGSVTKAQRECRIYYERVLSEKPQTPGHSFDREIHVKPSTGSLNHHRDRAKIYLLEAVSYLRKNEIAQSTQLIRLAGKLGCSKRTISSILIAEIYNTIGRAAASVDQEQKALKHFESAVVLESHRSNTRQLAEYRYEVQRKQINSCSNCVQPHLNITKRKFNDINENLFLFNHESEKNSQKIIVVAGMRHSGSTALFNIIRLALEETGTEYLSCYSEHHEGVRKIIESGQTGLIKTHELRDDVVEIASVVLTTTRDLRDTVASAVRRKFPMLVKIGSPVEYAKYNRSLNECWSDISDYRFIYENFMQNPTECIKDIIAFLGFSSVDHNKIHHLVSNLPIDNYKTTLLSPTHITDPNHKLSYIDTLDLKTIVKIEEQNYKWLARYGYVPSQYLN